MRRPPMRSERPSQGLSPWMPWVATVTVAVVLLVIIVIAATMDGLRIRSEMWEQEVLRGNVPARETVYPGSIPALPTVLAAPQGGEEVSGLESPFKSLAMDTVLRSGPGSEYAIIKDLVAGEQVQVLTQPIEIQGQQWQRVRASQGQVGWCMVNELIPASARE